MKEARYFRVGLFLLLGIASIVVAILVLAGGRLFEDRVLAETFFDESVSGLQVGSIVEARGVRLGQVVAIDFADNVYAPEQFGETGLERRLIRVVMDLSARPGEMDEEVRRERINTMVEEGLRLRLSTQPLTNQSFLQAEWLDPERNPVLEIPWETEHEHIPSAPSQLAAITTAVERMFRRLEGVKIEQLIEHLDALILSANEQVKSLDLGRLQDDAVALMEEVRTTLRLARQDLLATDLPGVGLRARDALEQLDYTLATAERTIGGGNDDLQATLENLRIATENLRDLTATAREFPSFVILGGEPRPAQAVTP